MKNGSELLSIFKQFNHEIKTQFGVSIWSFPSDDAREYLSHQFQIGLPLYAFSKNIICKSCAMEIVEMKNIYKPIL